MSELQLYPHQVDVRDQAREAFRARHRTIMLYAPTGFGKTEIACDLLRATAANGKRAAIILDRINLCNQTSERLQKYNIDHGVMQAGHWRHRPYEPIQVCSAQTLEKRGSFPALDLLIVDEAHAKRRDTISLIQNNPRIRVIGLSASPFTEGLGAVYSAVVSSCTTKWLVDNEYLASLKVFVAKEIDMTGAKKVAGEWSDKAATERGVKITGDVVAEWAKKTNEIFGGPRKTLVFCAGVAHGADLALKFGEAGYNFIAISYRDTDDFKAEVIAEFSKPDSSIHGLISTDILTKGFDVPDCMIGISARPFSKSFSSHIQQMGRVMRRADGKEFAVWLDHSGNYLRFREQWDALYSDGVTELHDGKEQPAKEPEPKEKEDAKCPACGALWHGDTDVCAHCGHVRTRRNEVIATPGELEELEPGKKKEKHSTEFKERFYRQLLGYALEHGYKPGWAYHSHKDKFGVYPSTQFRKHPLTPEQEVQNWIRHRNIKRAKSRRR